MSQENVEVVRRWWEGFNQDGMPPLSLCDHEIEITNPADFPVRGPEIVTWAPNQAEPRRATLAV